MFASQLDECYSWGAMNGAETDFGGVAAIKGF